MDEAKIQEELDQEQELSEHEKMMQMEARVAVARKLARELRWLAPGKSTVTHPDYGKVVVPHYSNLAAFDNAAEYWGVKADSDFFAKARCMAWEPGDGRVVRPREFCGRTEKKRSLDPPKPREQGDEEVSQGAP